MSNILGLFALATESFSPLGRLKNTRLVVDLCASVAGKSAVACVCRASQYPKRVSMTPTSLFHVYIVARQKPATSLLSTSSICSSVLLATTSPLRRKIEFVGTWKDSSLSPSPSIVLGATGFSRISWTSLRRSRAISRKM